jgi:hypothetical protein
MFDQAFKRATELAAVFEANPFAAAHVVAREVQLATSLPILQASTEHRSFILAMSAWVGALHACRLGYWEVVEPLVRGACKMAIDTRGLWRLSQNFMLFLLQLVPALKEPAADRVAAVASGIRISMELHGDEETHWRTLLDECSSGNVPMYLYTPAQQQYGSLLRLIVLSFLMLVAQVTRCPSVLGSSLSYLQEIQHQGLFQR